MNVTPHDPSPRPEREPTTAWGHEPESPDRDPDHQPPRPDEHPPIEEPGYGHGV
jgi:hypothetical protein